MTFDIELSQVVKTFGNTNAVNNVSLQIRSGEFLTLLGPSGCGKTTLLRMIAGFEHPTSGKIMLGGVDVTYLPPYKRNVHTVFQQYALFPHRTVAGNIAFGLELKGLTKTLIKEKIDKVLEMVQLQGFENRYPKELSGGQQQRIAIARALVLEPRVLLLDEPLGALDLKLRKEMQVELKKLQQKLGISFVFVTHDQEEALVMSDRIAVMSRGKIEQLGSATEIYERPNTEFVANFIGVSNLLETEVLNITGKTFSLSLDGKELTLSTSQVSQNLKVGSKVKLVIRPEKITLSTLSENSIVKGVIEEKVYFGTNTQWRVKLSDLTSIIVYEQNRSASNTYSVNQEVYLSWDEESNVILSEDAK
ncbi:MAG: ABC transporter ATP-binding protein [Acidobacteria bacterium]|nr:ABC transporter ATP-binding protein [Acidobacteriota bacterium]